MNRKAKELIEERHKTEMAPIIIGGDGRLGRRSDNYITIGRPQCDGHKRGVVGIIKTDSTIKENPTTPDQHFFTSLHPIFIGKMMIFLKP